MSLSIANRQSKIANLQSPYPHFSPKIAGHGPASPNAVVGVSKAEIRLFYKFFRTTNFRNSLSDKQLHLGSRAMPKKNQKSWKLNLNISNKRFIL